MARQTFVTPVTADIRSGTNLDGFTQIRICLVEET